MSSGIERRRYPRVDIKNKRIEVSYGYYDSTEILFDKNLMFDLINISEGGIGLKTKDNIDEIKLHSILFSDIVLEDKVSLMFKVVRIQTCDAWNVLGCELLTNRDIVKNYIDKLTNLESIDDELGMTGDNRI